MLRTLLAVPVAASLLVAAPASPAAAAAAATFQCTIDVAGGWDDCFGAVTVTTSSGNQRVATVDLAGGYVRLDAFVDACSPSAWWIHFADSPTANGYGGDAGTTEHDAEANLYGARFDHYGTYDGLGGVDPIVLRQDASPTAGCFRTQWSIWEDNVRFDDDGDPADAARVALSSPASFESAPYAESDAEDPSGSDADKWYVGINRTVGASYRSGSGANRVCLVLSTTTSPSAATLSAVCP